MYIVYDNIVNYLIVVKVVQLINTLINFCRLTSYEPRGFLERQTQTECYPMLYNDFKQAFITYKLYN